MTWPSRLTRFQSLQPDIPSSAKVSAHVVRLVVREMHAYSLIAGDAMVRELDISRITLRLMEKEDKKGGDDEHVFAKLSGDTLSILQQCLVGTSSIFHLPSSIFHLNE